MAMMPSGSGGGSGGSRTGSPFVIDHDDDSSMDRDFLEADEGMVLYTIPFSFQLQHPRTTN